MRRQIPGLHSSKIKETEARSPVRGFLFRVTEPGTPQSTKIILGAPDLLWLEPQSSTNRALLAGRECTERALPGKLLIGVFSNLGLASILRASEIQ